MKNLLLSQLVRLHPYDIQFAWAFDPERFLWRAQDVVMPQLRSYYPNNTREVS